MPSSEGSREIDAARRRLAAAKHQASSTNKNLETACAMELLARTNKERAQANAKCTQKEVNAAESALRQAEKRWEVIEIDVDAADSPIKNNSKRRKVSVTPELEEGVNSNDDDGGGVNLRSSLGAVGGGASSVLEKDSSNDNDNEDVNRSRVTNNDGDTTSSSNDIEVQSPNNNVIEGVPDDVIVEGCGIQEVNGTFRLLASANGYWKQSGGETYWIKYLATPSKHWRIRRQDDGKALYMASANPNNARAPPVNGWLTVGDGVSPAPKLTCA